MTKGNEMTKKYIGTKIVTAFEQPDPRPVPAGATPEKGYGVIYEDGYQSWSPARAFEPAYRAIEGAAQALTFGDAIHMLKMGKKVARAGWNGKGMFVWLVGGHEQASEFNADHVFFNDYFVIKNVNETLSTWVPSINDCLAEDWSVVD